MTPDPRLIELRELFLSAPESTSTRRARDRALAAAGRHRAAPGEAPHAARGVHADLDRGRLRDRADLAVPAAAPRPHARDRSLDAELDALLLRRAVPRRDLPELRRAALEAHAAGEEPRAGARPAARELERGADGSSAALARMRRAGYPPRFPEGDCIGGGGSNHGRTGGRRALGSLRSLREPRRPAHRRRPRRRARRRRARFASALRGRVAALGAAELAAAVDALEALQEPVARAGAYASLLFAADTAAPRHGALLQHVQERGTAIRNELLFFELEWVAVDVRARRGAARRSGPRAPAPLPRGGAPLPPARALRAGGEGPRRDRQHRAQRLLAALRRDARRHELPRARRRAGRRNRSPKRRCSRCLYEPRRARRREAAAQALTEGLRANARVLGFIFNTLVQDKSLAGPPAQLSLADGVAPPRQRDRGGVRRVAARRLRAPLPAGRALLPPEGELLGLPRLADYDRYAPLGDDAGLRSFEEARRIVEGAYADFSPRLAEIAARFFDERWIDAELRAGKRGGAFCASTVPSAHPYVLLQLHRQPARRDDGRARARPRRAPVPGARARSLRAGHAAHHRRDRERLRRDAGLPPAAARRARPGARLALLCGKLEDAFATVFRQVVMTRFEESLHAARRAEGELPLERINELWMDANRPMFGDSVELRRRLRLVVALHPALRPLALLLLRLRLRRAAGAGAAAPLRRGGPGLRAALPRAARGRRLRHAASVCSRASASTSPTRPSGTAASRCSRRWWRRRRSWRARRFRRTQASGRPGNANSREAQRGRRNDGREETDHRRRRAGPRQPELDDRRSARPDAARRTSGSSRSSPTSTARSSPSAGCTPRAPARSAPSPSPTTSPGTPRRRSSRRSARRPTCSSASRPSPASAARPTPSATSAASP